MRALIYVDTEFTDLLNIDLISIALVCEKDHFYAERSDYDRSLCSAFTREAVLPHLGQLKAPVTTWEELRLSVRGWLERYSNQDATLCFDNVVDYNLLLELLGERPSWMSATNIRDKIDQSRLDNYFLYHYAVRHHALYDALANQYAHQPNV
jgi:hypothetical protein